MRAISIKLPDHLDRELTALALAAGELPVDAPVNSGSRSWNTLLRTPARRARRVGVVRSDDAAHPETQNHAARMPDEVDIDGNPRSFLNRGTCDFPKPGGSDMARFGQAGDFGFADGATKNLADTQVTRGESRVRLHVSNVAGDSLVVQARMKNSPHITPSGQRQTGVMTVWKRIDVEYVRMAGAFALPIDKVPPFFEPARVQMDFASERQVASKPFLTKLDKNEESACATYASKTTGEFRSEGKPGWFFLAAERASSESFSTPGSSDSGGSPANTYVGKAHVAVAPDRADGSISEILVIDQASSRSKAASW